MKTTLFRYAISAVLALASAISAARADTPPPGWSASKVELVGYTIMNEHPAFKITMTRAGDRYYIMGGHFLRYTGPRP